MIRYNSQTKVVNLLKNFLFWLRLIWAQFGPNLCGHISHDSLSKDLFEVLWHHEIQKSPFGKYGPNLKPSVLLFALCGLFLNVVV